MSKRNDDLEAELKSHLEMAKRDLVERGASEEEARAAARREFGNAELVKETVHDVWGVRWLEDFTDDIRYAFRALRKNPGYSAVAILTIALGIGLNAAIFGLVDAVLLNALPFQDPERLVHVWTTNASGELHTPVVNEYSAVTKFSHSFSEVAAAGWVDNFYGSDESGWQRMPGLVVSANWLKTLGVRVQLGRDFLEEEQTAGRNNVVLLSYACWRTFFHADREIIGRQILLDRKPVTVVGILPQSFSAYPEYDDVQAIAPLVLDQYEGAATLKVAGMPRLRIIARLRPGVTLEQARAELQAVAEGLRGPREANDRSGRLTAEGFGELLRTLGPTAQNGRRGLLLMAVAAGVVLLVACANVAALLLARGVRRQHEMAVRLAIGCSRSRMVRQLLAESIALFACGGFAGLLAAKSSEAFMTQAAAGLIPGASYAQISVRVLAGGLVASVLCALAFGLIPALQMTRVDPNEKLKDTADKTTSGLGIRRARKLILVFQVALGMVLMVGFGLLLRSLKHVESAPLGFDPGNVLTATVTLPSSRYGDASRRAQCLNLALEQMSAVPGTESAAITDYLPMNGADSDQLKIEAGSSRTRPIEEETWFLSVSPHYFSTLRIPLLAGRSFTDRDVMGASAVAIVNQTFANSYFPGGSPIGFHVAFGDAPAPWREIVGVVSDFRQRNPEEDVRPLLYLPVAQTLPNRWSLVIREQGLGNASAIKEQVRAALQPIDPQLYWQFGSLDQQIRDSESLTMRRPIIAFLALLAALALVLIVVGVFGVSSYLVAERRREIGIRVALGAAPAEVVSLVLRESLSTAVWGLCLGAFAAFAVAKLFPTGPIGWSGSGIFLYGVSRTDPLTYLVAAGVLLSVAVFASCGPTRRALGLDPVAALRYE